MPSRRKIFAVFLALSGVGAFATLFRREERKLKTFPLDFQWPVQEPFIFCAHHHDHYPSGNEKFGPPPSELVGRDMGQDFDPSNAYRMYHGEEVPGFPVHPHRGFETITIVRKGYVDHADSMGAAGRYGEGDVQWMTAGAGVQHSEMFPLLRRDQPNTLELFQIWLNLPKKSKSVAPHFSMFWSEKIPRLVRDGVNVTLIAGEFGGVKALQAPPDSWAADPANEVTILLMKFSKGRLELPSVSGSTNRTLYFLEGSGLEVNGLKVSGKTGVQLDPGDVTLAAESGEVLLLQAKPIGEPVFQHGPFVMNSKDDIIRTIQDYQRTGFGGWPWKRQDMVHGEKIERFARFPDGRTEKPVG